MAIRVRANRRTELFDKGDEFDVIEGTLSSPKLVITCKGRLVTVPREFVDEIVSTKKPAEIDFSEITRKISRRLI